ncbi:hypothetical protein PG996_010824 [Apiospora saccharicola]|uniref:Uncharacterized protein n=1 Tax=Apiospora saccharicola TaxID=335842 RepID=A0ABR1UPN7_9PEZI
MYSLVHFLPIVAFLCGGSGTGRKALARGSGKPYVPVCFSLGCRYYLISSIFKIFLGNKSLLPLPDYPCKLFNLSRGGEPFESDNFVVGRLLRDLETSEAHELKIGVFAADPNPGSILAQSLRGRTRGVGLVATLAQFATAAVTYFLGRGPSVLFITLAGTLLVQCCAWVPQWAAEKLPAPTYRESNFIYALTCGRGSRNVMVIVGNNCYLDLEQLACSSSPRKSQFGVSRGWLLQWWKTWPFASKRRGFVMTQLVYAIILVLWMCLFVAMYMSAGDALSLLSLLAVGCIGARYNAWLAKKYFPPEMQDISLRKLDDFASGTAMDAIMDFQMVYERGRPLLREFFPDGFRGEAERRWWDDTDSLEYGLERDKAGHRGFPLAYGSIPIRGRCNIPSAARHFELCADPELDDRDFFVRSLVSVS